MEKFIRTTGGSIWQLGPDGNYHKPNVANYVSGDSDSVVAASDDVRELVRVGDLVKFEHEDIGVREVNKKDLIAGTDCISKYWCFDAIYTKLEKNGIVKSYVLQAVKIAGTWAVVE